MKGDNYLKLYLVRHGETEWNRQYRYYGKTDIELNDKGKEQAKQIGELLRDVSFDKVYTSTLKRAQQTEEIIEKSIHKIEEKNRRKTITSFRLAEQDLGIFEGYTYRELEKQFPKELESWNQDFKSAPHGGESFYEFYDRIYKFCEKELEISGLQQRQQNLDLFHKETTRLSVTVPEKRADEKILIVSHMAVLRCLVTILLGMHEDAIWNFTMEQGAYSRIDIEDGCVIIRKLNQS